jgi:hypothetical protein
LKRSILCVREAESHRVSGHESLVGSPNPKVEEGMRREHCDRLNAKSEFVTSNYNIKTFPELEWHFVVDPTKYDFKKLPAGSPFNSFPHTKAERNGDHCRNIIELGKIMEHETCKAAEVKKEEVTAMRLYTGPMFYLYNAALREFPAEIHESLKGNRSHSHPTHSAEEGLVCMYGALARTDTIMCISCDP